MLHLYDFMGVTGPQQVFTFVSGHLLEIMECPAIHYTDKTRSARETSREQGNNGHG